MTIRSANITSRDVDGICFVRNLTDAHQIDEWVSHDDHYYLNQSITPEGTLVALKKSDFSKCKSCYYDRINTLRRNDLLRARHQALRGLELFSGMSVSFRRDTIGTNTFRRCWRPEYRF